MRGGALTIVRIFFGIYFTFLGYRQLNWLFEEERLSALYDEKIIFGVFLTIGAVLFFGGLCLVFDVFSRFAAILIGVFILVQLTNYYLTQADIAVHFDFYVVKQLAYTFGLFVLSYFEFKRH